MLYVDCAPVCDDKEVLKLLNNLRVWTAIIEFVGEKNKLRFIKLIKILNILLIYIYSSLNLVQVEKI